jgi:RNA polymerase sigma-70 factor (ECF subfamily)
MGIFRSEKADTPPIGSHGAAPAPGYQHAAADDRRRRLEDLFREHAPRVLDYARYRGATLAEAEDVVSDVFMVVTRRLEELPVAVEEFIPWLLGAARKVLGNQLRGSRRRQALIERSEEALMLAGRSDPDLSAVATRNLIIRQGLSKLKEKEREALLLVTWDGFQYDEAAGVLGISPGALAQRVLRARQVLLEEIGDIRTYRDIEGKDLSAPE